MFWNYKLNESVVIPYAAAHYYTTKCGWSEFLKDLSLFKRVGFHFVKVHEIQALTNFKIALNNTIMFCNSFSGDAVGRLLFYYVEPVAHSEVYTILHCLHRMPHKTFEAQIDKIAISQPVLRLFNEI